MTKACWTYPNHSFLGEFKGNNFGDLHKEFVGSLKKTNLCPYCGQNGDVVEENFSFSKGGN